jgi:ribose transport system substrate-binding protein
MGNANALPFSATVIYCLIANFLPHNHTPIGHAKLKPSFPSNDVMRSISFLLVRENDLKMRSLCCANTCWSLFALVLFGIVGGCEPSGSSAKPTSDATTPKPAGSKLRIAVIPKGTSHQFWQSVHAGADAAAKELQDVEIIWKGPETEADTAGQISVVKNFITNGVNGICLAPNHSQALVDVVAEAAAEKIPVVVFDSGLAKGAPVVSYVATDNFRGGQLAGKRLIEAMGNKGKVILLRYKEGSESTEQREKGFLDAIAQAKEVSVLSSDQYAGTTTQEALAKATQLLNKYRDEVTGIFSVCEPNANGTYEALLQTGLAGKVKFVAFDPSDSLIRGMDEDKVCGIMLQDPFEMGRQSVLTIVKHLRGEKVEAVQSTGEYVATPENQKTQPYDRLLRPVLYKP